MPSPKLVPLLLSDGERESPEALVLDNYATHKTPSTSGTRAQAIRLDEILR